MQAMARRARSASINATDHLMEWLESKEFGFMYQTPKQN
jgi:hypothetical protein